MQLLFNALIAGSFAALMAGGLALVYGVLKVFNLSLGQFALVGGYVTWWLHQAMGLPAAVSIVGGIVAGALVSWVAFEVSVAPFYKRHRFLPLVTTLAFSMILDGLLQILFKEDPKSILGPAKHLLEFNGAVISVEQLVLIVITVLLLLGTAWLLSATPIGRRIRATVQHSNAAESLGIRSNVLHRLVFIASGVLAAMAGIYVGIDHNLTPTLGFVITIRAYAALIVGGKDSLWGTILAAYLIALCEQLAIGVQWFGYYIPAGYQGTVALGLMMIVLLVKPSGLFGSKTRIA